MDYYFYNTDTKTTPAVRGLFPKLIERGFAATSGPIKFGELLGKLKPGDTLLMYENKEGVVAVGRVLEQWDGESHSDPQYYPPEADSGHESESWFGHEYRIEVDWYLDLSASPIAIAELRQRIGYTPRGAVTQFVKKRPIVEAMIQEREAGQDTLADDIEAIVKSSVDSTTKKSLVNARIGQGLFRQEVLRRWGNRCSVTRSVTLDAIRASHIKRWCESSNEERLDPENGLPLVASLDALFDKGLVSFDSAGKLIISSQLNANERQLFGLNKCSLTRTPTVKTAEYLAFHREKVFRA
jgi:hypothetical protein